MTSAELIAVIAGVVSGAVSGTGVAAIRGHFEIKKMKKVREDIVADREQDAEADLRAAAAALVHALPDESDVTGLGLRTAKGKVEIAQSRIQSDSPLAADAAALLKASTDEDLEAAKAVATKLGGT